MHKFSYYILSVNFLKVCNNSQEICLSLLSFSFALTLFSLSSVKAVMERRCETEFFLSFYYNFLWEIRYVLLCLWFVYICPVLIHCHCCRWVRVDNTEESFKCQVLISKSVSFVSEYSKHMCSSQEKACLLEEEIILERIWWEISLCS